MQNNGILASCIAKHLYENSYAIKKALKDSSLLTEQERYLFLIHKSFNVDNVNLTNRARDHEDVHVELCLRGKV